MWIDTKGGFVNLATAASIRLLRYGAAPGELDTYQITDARGHDHIHQTRNLPDQVYVPSTIIPAAGTLHLHIYYCEPGEEPDIWCEVAPIIGWEYTKHDFGYDLMPIVPTANNLAQENCLGLLELPDRQWLETGRDGRIYRTLPDALEALRSMVKAAMALAAERAARRAPPSASPRLPRGQDPAAGAGS